MVDRLSQSRNCFSQTRRRCLRRKVGITTIPDGVARTVLRRARDHIRETHEANVLEVDESHENERVICQVCKIEDVAATGHHIGRVIASAGLAAKGETPAKPR